MIPDKSSDHVEADKKQMTLREFNTSIQAASIVMVTSTSQDICILKIILVNYSLEISLENKKPRKIFSRTSSFLRQNKRKVLSKLYRSLFYKTKKL